MALVDPYSPCPCGSLVKYKFCCHKAEAAAIRAERLIRTEQFDQALKAVDEGLAKEKGNAWLLSQKSYVLERKGDLSGSHAALEEIHRAKPDHQGAWAARVSLVLAGGGLRAGVDELQLALASCGHEVGPQLLSAILMTGVTLARGEHVFAGLAHLKLGLAADQENPDSLALNTLSSLFADPSVSPWLKNDYQLAPAPDSLSPERKAYFEEALREAGLGNWSRAAARFEMLAAENVPGADLNLGLCRLFTLDPASGVPALRRHIATLGNSTEAVDLEALAQLEEPIDDDFLVDRVRLSWPLRDREALLKALTDQVENKKTALEEEEEPIDPADQDGPTALVYALLDRPIPDARPGLPAADLPRVVARVLVADDRVYLEALDGPQLNDLRDRFLELAGPGVPNAHPKLKVADRLPRHALALRTEWIFPNGLDRADIQRIEAEEQTRILSEIWPETPLPFLGGRSPSQAARAGDAEVPLRATLLQQEVSSASQAAADRVGGLRASLGVPPEPIPDPATADLVALHLGRLGLVPADQLSDENLEILRVRARGYLLGTALEHACRALIARPAALDAKPASARFQVFGDLVQSCLLRRDDEAALAAIAQGRQGEPGPHRSENAPRWDLLEVRVRARREAPDQWVPELAAILERYRENQQASQTILSNLLDMGLIRMVPHPEKPDQMLLDTRALNLLLERYGPRVVTSSGTLGVAATKPDIWTPEKATGGPSGGLWTPGSSSPPDEGGDKPKLILPGR